MISTIHKEEIFLDPWQAEIHRRNLMMVSRSEDLLKSLPDPFAGWYASENWGGVGRADLEEDSDYDDDACFDSDYDDFPL